ncbi:MAG TPA: histidine phosphatase family protein [Gemmatimonadaceae bacterium]|nr:histidine phosphatase family protein [Gemmatimonadaceae bacterium]
MPLLLIRHAPAGSHSEWMQTGRPDSERPLTVDGREKMRLAAPALAGLVPKIDVLATSPFARAYQTAEIVGKAYTELAPTIVDSLASGGDRSELLEWIRGHRPGSTLALVGHNPDLEELASWMLAAREHAFVRLRKGSAALIRFDTAPVPGGGVLQWLLDPDQMREIVLGRSRSA